MKKCKYCDDNECEEIYSDIKLGSKKDCNVGIDIYIQQNNLYVESSADTYEPSYNEAKVEINYCPMCGRKLNNKVLGDNGKNQ